MKIDISIVMPVLNERESLLQLHEELRTTLDGITSAYELVFVDDGSTDGSTELLRDLAQRDPQVVLVEMRRRFGKATALQAGFGLVQGTIVFTLDADLQDDPKEIPRFLAELDKGFDLVTGWKLDRQDPISKTLPSKLFNAVTSFVGGLKLRDYNCGFKAYRREVVERLDIYGELYRYIPLIVHSKGFLVGEIPVSHRPRVFGKSKYGLERFMRGALDLFTISFLATFRKRPLHLFGPIGLAVGALGIAIDTYLAVLWFMGQGIGERPLLMLGTLMIIVGVQILIFGLLGEMITSTTHQASEAAALIRRVTRGAEQRAGAVRSA
ncbi:MAG: glycosyltransferase family 2 protein [Gammaproteobacteria bacterium]